MIRERIINDIISWIQKSIQKKNSENSTYITVLAKALISCVIFLYSFVLVFKMTLYNIVLDSLIPLTPTRSGAVVVFNGGVAEAFKSQGRVHDGIS